MKLQLLLYFPAEINCHKKRAGLRYNADFQLAYFFCFLFSVFDFPFSVFYFLFLIFRFLFSIFCFLFSVFYFLFLIFRFRFSIFGFRFSVFCLLLLSRTLLLICDLQKYKPKCKENCQTRYRYINRTAGKLDCGNHS